MRCGESFVQGREDARFAGDGRDADAKKQLRDNRL
jgi:hypothetical protein